MSDKTKLEPKKVLMPGIWVDTNDNLHFSIPDLLDLFGWPHDEEHKREVEKKIREIVEKDFMAAAIRIDACPNCGAMGAEPHGRSCPLAEKEDA